MEDNLNNVTRCTFSLQDIAVEVAIWGIVMTIFILLLLVMGAMVFTYDANRLVLVPIEKLISIVTEIGENPLAEKFHANTDDFDEELETTLLLNTINKAGHLLRVGFGHEGATIISYSLKGDTGKLKLSY